jgi:flagellar biosynthesis/type III secretory pathway M-ring protein FliF/YscJ
LKGLSLKINNLTKERYELNMSNKTKRIILAGIITGIIMLIVVIMTNWSKLDTKDYILFYLLFYLVKHDLNDLEE